MNFDALAYPEKIIIAGSEFSGQRDMSKGTILVPYTDEPDVGIGDIITQKTGKREVELKVIDAQFQPGGTLGVGTKHNNLLKLKVENFMTQPHTTNTQSSIFNIGSITGEQVQVGSNNSQIVNISVQSLVEAVAKSGDQEAKSALRNLLENSTVASIVGAGAAALLGLL
ncbi:hypothetical protein [Pseudomonas sp. MYb185]|uniref:hypothetical protein n=1 Tax=Pseudomonas sp. MYb185 TaxID=1848729 RepID=UPI000CFD6F96|nr:hypothetical protein [Pseudomonas sp. MYb185]PRB77552.1 hypothetical protein CQ007_16605 [Pseudomonas sp. MYb185]